MRTTLIILFTIIVHVAYGQDKVPFEQIAFDFYRDSILKSTPQRTRLTLWTELDKENFFSHRPDCLKEFNISHGNGIINLNPSGRSSIELKRDRRFRIKKENTGRFPRVYVTVSFSTLNNQHIVTIVEAYKYEGVTYHIELNNSGNIINWCNGGWL